MNTRQTYSELGTTETHGTGSEWQERERDKDVSE